MSTVRTASRGRKLLRYMGRAAGVAVLLLMLAGLAAWIWRVDLTTFAIVRVLERQGLGPVALSLDAVETDGLRLARLSLRGGAIATGAVEVGYDIPGLLAGHVAGVAITGLSLDLVQSGRGIEVGGRPLIEPGAPDPAEAPSAPLAGIAIDAFRLDDAHVTFTRPEGVFAATITTEAALAGSAIASSLFTARLTGPVDGAERVVSVTAASLALELLADGGVKAGLGKALVESPGLPWLARDADLDLALGGEGAVLSFTVAEIRNLQQPALLIPVSLSGKATLAGDRLDLSLKGAAVAQAGARIELSGQYDLAADAGTATVALAPVVFKRGGLQPVALAPALGLPLKDVEGTVGLSGQVRLARGVLTSDLGLKITGLGFVADTATVSGVDGTIRITRPWPPATAPAQRLRATVSAAGESAAIDLTGQLTAKPSLKLDKVLIGVAGGEFSASPFTVDLGRPVVQTTLTVSHLDLAEVTRILGIDGLGGSGFLDGRIPVAVDGGKVTIAKGAVVAQGPGTLAYRPGNLPPQIAEAGEEMALTLQALANFRYDALTIEFEKAAEGEGFVMLRMAGSNPALLDGQPFNFNIRIESNFARLADLVLVSLRSAQDLLGRAAGSVGR